MKDPVKDKLKRFGLFARFGERYVLRNRGRIRQPLPRAVRHGLAGLEGPHAIGKRGLTRSKMTNEK